MDFARAAWRILVAIKDGLALLLLLIFFLALFALLSAGPNPAKVRNGALVIELAGVVSEQPSAIDPLEAIMSNAAPVGEYRQRDIIRALDIAIADDRIQAVVFDLDRFLGGGQASLSAIGERIDAVKKAGKPVYSFATAYSDDGYHLAAHASEIWMDPMGGVMFAGPGGSRSYYKGLLDRLGVTAHIYRVGTYKSAVEPFLRTDQSAESKEALQAVYDEIWGRYKADIIAARPAAQIKELIADPASAAEAARGDFAALAVEKKLVDKLGDRIAFGKFLAGKIGTDAGETIGGFAATPMEALLAAHTPDDDGDAIAVVTVAGEIVDGKAGPGVAAGDTVSGLIYGALENDDLKAMVLRVDSPGGSVLASEKIRLALQEVKQRKLPLVVSMANVAASGGYWISTPADKIFAEPETITGSIGIFGIIPSAEKALGKIGVTADGVKTTPLSGEPDVMGGIDPQFHRIAQSAIEKGYRDFLGRVAAARNKTPEQVDAIAQGRIWAGGTARQIGLVDGYGGIETALAEAAKLAKLEDGQWHAKYVEPESDFLAMLFANPGAAKAKAQPPLDLFARSAMQQQMMVQGMLADISGLTQAKGAQIWCLECGAMSGRWNAAQHRENGGYFSAMLKLWTGSER